MPNISSEQAYFHIIDSNIIYIKSINMYELTEISESFYKGVLEKLTLK